MNTIYNYLGLSKDILDCERNLNAETNERLPSYLSKGIIEKFHKTEELASVEGLPTLPRRSTVNLRALTRQASSSRYVVLASRSKSTHPGDLLSSVPLSRRSDYYETQTIPNESEDLPTIQRSSLRRRASHSTSLRKSNSVLEDIRVRGFSNEREETEETSLRTAIVEQIFTHLGISEDDPTVMNINPTSASSSASSSIVGISKLNYGSLDSINSPRVDPMTSIRSSLASNGNKVYQTINQHTKEADVLQEKPKKVVLPGSRGDDSDFVAVKDEFARAIQMKYIQPGKTIIEQDSFHTGKFNVIDGSLDVKQESNEKSKKI